MIHAGGDFFLTIRPIIPWLVLGHGIFNVVLAIPFFYQGWLGLAIWKARRAGAPLHLTAIRRHRKAGPILVVLGMIGFCAGVFLVLIDKGKLIEYPLHFLAGLVIVLCLATTYYLSRRIKSVNSISRTSHRVIGILILCFYPIQFLLGLGILL
jgi:hypothetical protein